MKSGAKLTIIKLAATAVLFAIFVITGLIDLDKDVINPDSINWHERTLAFSKALKEKDYSKTFQTYHPGTTLMWISSTAVNQATKENFLHQDYLAKLSVLIFTSMLFLLMTVILWKLVNFKYALFFSCIFSLEPFLLGSRRLYHLDFLMTVLLFLSFLLVGYFNYKSAQTKALVLAGLFFALALLTKSTAIILGNPAFKKKVLGFAVFTCSGLLFFYVFFPPIWTDPLKLIPKYVQKIVFGVETIGLAGRLELENAILDETIAKQPADFYIKSLAMRISVGTGIMLLVGAAVFTFMFFKKLKFHYSPAAWVSLWSILFSILVIVILSVATKKIDRYLIIVFPFLLTLIAYFLCKLRPLAAVGVFALYVGVLIAELLVTHPYYIAYSNPLLGDIRVRLYTLDDSPFGIATYTAVKAVLDDTQGKFYTIAGSKSVKAIAIGGKFSRAPSCVTDYVIIYVKDIEPIYVCRQKYTLLNTVKVADYDYWYIFKRLNQRHQKNN